MDNKKIGKLIAELRRKKGLTQQELGDKVGVGFRAVSKWERGITLPDISIINEVSKILGISSDELLSGELNKTNKTKKKFSIKITITLIILIVITILFSSILAEYNNKTYTYNIESTSDEYYVEGQVIIHKNKLTIMINKLKFSDAEFASTEIKNYEYQIITNDKLIIGYGSTPDTIVIEKINTIQDFTEKFRINYNDRTSFSKKEIVGNGLIVNVDFQTQDNQDISKKLEIKLTTSKTNKK